MKRVKIELNVFLHPKRPAQHSTGALAMACYLR